MYNTERGTFQRVHHELWDREETERQRKKAEMAARCSPGKDTERRRSRHGVKKELEASTYLMNFFDKEA